MSVMRVCRYAGCTVGGQVLLAWTVDVSCECDWFSGWLFFGGVCSTECLRNLSYYMYVSMYMSRCLTCNLSYYMYVSMYLSRCLTCNLSNCMQSKGRFLLDHRFCIL